MENLFKPIWVQPKTVAKMYDCSTQLVMKMIKRGELPAVYLSRSAVRIRVADLEQVFAKYNPTQPRGDRRRKNIRKAQ